MSYIVKFKQHGNIAVITLNHQPVNAFSYALRIKMKAAILRAIDDVMIEAIVLTGIERFFSVGTDITEFSSNAEVLEPNLAQLVACLCTSPKLVVAAINGAALGGGCEIALACHYRMMSNKAEIGLTEVKLGILPGAGGTQLLPRIAGVKVALDLIISGKSVSAEAALEKRIIDRVHNGDDIERAAIGYAQQLLNEGAPLRDPNTTRVDCSYLANDFFDTYRQSISKRSREQVAVENCIQCVQAACELPFTEGLKKESELFTECMQSPQAGAMQHLFFAERQARKVADVAANTPLRAIQQVAVIGAGIMGGGIAMNFANAGIPVMLLEVKQEALDRGLALIRKNYESSAKKGRLTTIQVEQRMALLSGTLSYDDLAEVDLVIEAVFEDMEIKKKVFQTLDGICKVGAILASNTSTLDIDDIATVTRRPADVIGLHFFSPANVMPLLEIVRGKQTANDVIATVMHTARVINKVAVLVGVCFGFVGNRMLGPYLNEAHRLLLEGATPKQVDETLVNLGMAMGPFTMSDLAGIDVGYLVRQGLTEDQQPDPSHTVVSDRLYHLGRYGQKTGRGFYIYEAGSRVPQEDPEVHQIIVAEAIKLGITRRAITPEEVQERCLYVLVNEGAKVLEDGIAARASDIDVIYVYGYGFPPTLGGPMYHADHIGLDRVHTALCEYRDQLGAYGKQWIEPAALLAELAGAGETFSKSKTSV
jgi:3-hydroxyacyl-CoA dehydrogenase